MHLLSQSSARLFNSCRKAYELRFERSLVPNVEPHELNFGSIFHDCLQAHHLGLDPFAVIKTKAAGDDAYNLTAMMRGYQHRYPSEDFEVLALEQEFDVPLLGLDGQPYGAWRRVGKFDGIVRRRDTGRLWLMEHKTAARVDAPYLGKLHMDFQIANYSDVSAIVYGEALEGVLYNVIRKLAKKQRARDEGHSDSEWAEKLAAAKNPKACKRHFRESDGDYAQRLTHAYNSPEMFYRAELMLSDGQLEDVRRESLQLAQDIEVAREKGRWYRNTDHCYKYHKACSYAPICMSRENPLVIQAQFTTKAPHSELTVKDTPDGDE